ncbi:MAG: hypothetical protein GY757_56215 [bacterium]|nr:hypothetical protein [bacterium]
MTLSPATPSAPQDYDYHRDESPAISWNSVPYFDARMMGSGGISLMASGAFAAAVNPAFIPQTEGLTAAVTYQAMTHEAFQYRGLNQGAANYDETISMNNSNFSGMALSYSLKGLRFSAGWYLSNILELPSFNINTDYWQLSAELSGMERSFFAAAAFSLGKKIDVGIKVDYLSGKREASIGETYKEYPFTIMRTENYDLSCIIPSIGLKVKLSPAWTLGATLVYPLKGKADRNMERLFSSDYVNFEMTNLTSSDDLYRPTRLHLGTSYTPYTNAQGKNKLTLALEMSYTLWSDYKYILYTETVPRDFKNTMTLAVGMEYGILKTRSDFYLRAGYRLDPQPVKTPTTSLHAVTCGLGLRTGIVTLDVGTYYCFGTTQGITYGHLVANSTLSIRLGGKK